MKTLSDLNLQGLTFRGCADEEFLQQELFIQTLNKIDTESPLMIELGSCDAYYSIVFNKFFRNKNVKNYCVEISEEFQEIGKNNALKSDSKNMIFITAGIGDLNELSSHVICDNIDIVEKYTFSDLLNINNIKYVDMLHMDIQGTEVSVLRDIIDNKLFTKIKYAFISTHPSDGKFGPSHNECLNLIKDINTEIYYNDEFNGGVGDGLIVLEFK